MRAPASTAGPVSTVTASGGTSTATAPLSYPEGMESGRQQCLTEVEARALIAGDLPPDRFVAVRDHLDECPDCRELLSDLVRDGAAAARRFRT